MVLLLLFKNKYLQQYYIMSVFLANGTTHYGKYDDPTANTVRIGEDGIISKNFNNTFGLNGDGFTYNGDEVLWSDVKNKVQALKAVEPSPNDTTLQVNNKINITDGTATPITTSFTPTTLFTGNQSMTWADIIAGSGSVGTLNAVLANGNVATGETASITLQDDGLVNSININKAGLTTTNDLTLDIGNDLILNGDNIIETTAGGFTANYLKIKINGQYYKLQLLSE